MNAYKITIDQKKQIENKPFHANQFFKPIQDIHGDWFIFQPEMEFLATNNSWKRATLTDFVPKPSEII